MTKLETEILSFTREEFYEYVWTAPATKLAEELGCSDVMIGKVCKSHDIPKPYSGYWALLAHGKEPEKTPLPVNVNESHPQLTFHKPPECKTTVDEPPQEAQFDDDIQAILIKSRRLKPIRVGTSLRSPHPLIEDVKDEWKHHDAYQNMSMEQRLRSFDRERKLTVAIEVSKQQRTRALRIMDSLIKRIEKVSGKIDIRPRRHQPHRYGTALLIGGEHVSDIRLREKNSRVKIVDEKAEFRWQRNRTEMVPSGILLIDAGPVSYGSKILLRDKKNLSIEDQLTTLVDEFIVQAGEMRIARRIREEKERQRELEEQQRQERQELIHEAREELLAKQEKEKARIEDLMLRAHHWKESQSLRNYLNAFRNKISENGDVNDEQYLKWGFEQADRLDPFCESSHSILDETIDESDERFQVRKPK